MSKSLGNFLTIRDVLNNHSAEALRYLLISSHYRSQLVYAEDSLQQSQQALTRFYTALRSLPAAEPMKRSRFEADFCEAMNDDFNTPIALSVLFDLTHTISRLRETDVPAAAAHGALLKQLGAVLGILQADPEQYFKADLLGNTGEIDQLVASREQARREKNWEAADRIRKQLEALQITVEDTPTGPVWRKS